MSIYNALILPHFDYCSLVWDTCSNYLIENLQKLQSRAARVISGKSYEIRSCEILSDLACWRPLAERMKFKKATFMYNVKNNNNEFHNLRSNAVNFHIPKPKANFLKKSIYILFSVFSLFKILLCIIVI